MRKWRAEIWIAAIVVVASAVTGYYMLRPTGGISVPSTTLSGRLTLSPYAAMGTPAAISTAGLGPGEWTVSAYGGCTDLTCDLSGNIYLVDATYTEADTLAAGLTERASAGALGKLISKSSIHPEPASGCGPWSRPEGTTGSK